MFFFFFGVYWIQCCSQCILLSLSRAAKLSLCILFFSWWYSPPCVQNSLVGGHGSLLRFAFLAFLFIISLQIQIRLLHMVLCEYIQIHETTYVLWIVTILTHVLINLRTRGSLWSRTSSEFSGHFVFITQKGTFALGWAYWYKNLVTSIVETKGS